MNTLAPIALGTWSWGSGFAGGDQVFGNHLTDDQIQAAFETALKTGLTLWDTAAVYGMGTSEAALGKLVKQHARNELVLSTKFTPQIADERADTPWPPCSRAACSALAVITSISTGFTIRTMWRSGRRA